MPGKGQRAPGYPAVCCEGAPLIGVLPLPFSLKREHTSQQAWENAAYKPLAVQCIIGIYTSTLNTLNSLRSVIQIYVSKKKKKDNFWLETGQYKSSSSLGPGIKCRLKGTPTHPDLGSGCGSSHQTVAGRTGAVLDESMKQSHVAEGF